MKYIVLLSAIMLLVVPAVLAETSTSQGADRAGDAGILSIDLPAAYQRVDVDVSPSGTVRNFGFSDITAYFDVTCFITDSLLAGSVGMLIPPDLTPVHEDAMVEAINLAFTSM